MGNSQELVVVKLGGRTQGDPLLPSALAALWKRTGGRLVIVHGGGDQISALQRMRGEEPVFVGGRRVSTPLVLELVRMVLSGGANKQLVSALTSQGVPAVGISGEDAALLPATPIDRATFGSSGTPGHVDPKLVHHLLSGGYLPVISPVGTDTHDAAHGALNINGDDAAAAIAVALGADELLLMIDVEGVLDADKQLIPSLTLAETRELIASGVAGGGMAAKLEACEIALTGNVRRVRVGNIASLERPDAGTGIMGLGIEKAQHR
ncbi:MAG: acetylglutamate kinase [Gemmatimonas sp.]